MSGQRSGMRRVTTAAVGRCHRARSGALGRAAERGGSPGSAGPATVRQRPLLDVQRVAQPGQRRSAHQRPVDPGQRTGRQRRRDHPARTTRRPARERVRLRRGRDRAAAVPGQLPVGLAQWFGADLVRLPVHRSVEHRHPVRLRPQQRRDHRRTGRRVRLRVLPGSVRDGGLLELPDRGEQDQDVPEVPLEGHAGVAAADRLVLARGAGDLPAVVEEPLGRADQGRPAHRPLPREPPDAAGLRRCRGPQRSPQLRRDPALGRLHLADEVGLHLRRRWSAAVGSSRGRAS